MGLVKVGKFVLTIFDFLTGFRDGFTEELIAVFARGGGAAPTVFVKPHLTSLVNDRDDGVIGLENLLTSLFRADGDNELVS